MTKQESGRKGGQTTLQKYGKAHFSRIGKLGYAKIRELYRIIPYSTSEWALVRKSDNKILKHWH